MNNKYSTILEDALDVTLPTATEAYDKLLKYLIDLNPNHEVAKLKITAAKMLETGLFLYRDEHAPSCLLTVNPKPDIKVITLLKYLDDVVIGARKIPWITRVIYVVEQRGDTLDNLGKGIHVHMILTWRDKRMSDVKKFMNPRVKKHDLLNIRNPSVYNWRYLKTKTDYMKVYDYMCGNKADNEKTKKTEIDKIFRLKYQIDDIYDYDVTTQ